MGDHAELPNLSLQQHRVHEECLVGITPHMVRSPLEVNLTTTTLHKDSQG